MLHKFFRGVLGQNRTVIGWLFLDCLFLGPLQVLPAPPPNSTPIRFFGEGLAGLDGNWAFAEFDTGVELGFFLYHGLFPSRFLLDLADADTLAELWIDLAVVLASFPLFSTPISPPMPL